MPNSPMIQEVARRKLLSLASPPHRCRLRTCRMFASLKRWAYAVAAPAAALSLVTFALVGCDA